MQMDNEFILLTLPYQYKIMLLLLYYFFLLFFSQNSGAKFLHKIHLLLIPIKFTEGKNLNLYIIHILGLVKL